MNKGRSICPRKIPTMTSNKHFLFIVLITTVLVMGVPRADGKTGAGGYGSVVCIYIAIS
jgi:hypothetical protein